MNNRYDIGINLNAPAFKFKLLYCVYVLDFLKVSFISSSNQVLVLRLLPVMHLEFFYCEVILRFMYCLL